MRLFIGVTALTAAALCAAAASALTRGDAPRPHQLVAPARTRAFDAPRAWRLVQRQLVYGLVRRLEAQRTGGRP